MNKEKFYKSEGVRDCVKWLEKKIKEAQQEREEFTDDYGYLATQINTMIKIKISLEKYMKKLRHEAEENDNYY